MKSRTWLLAAFLVLGTASQAAAEALDVTPYIERDQFGVLKISPDGTHYAATVPLGDRTALAILRRADNKLTGSIGLGKNAHVHEFWWVTDDKVMFSAAHKIGLLDQPQPTGDLYVTDREGSGEMLAGQTLHAEQVGSNIKGKQMERAWVFMADPIARDGRNVVVSVVPFSNDPFTRAERLDINTGRRSTIARAPVRNARFATDNAGEVRAAAGSGVDNLGRLYLRDGKGDDWTLVNDEAVSGVVEVPIGFSADNATMYLRSERRAGTDAIVAYDVATGSRRTLLVDEQSDPSVVLRDAGGVPVGALYLGAKPRTAFIDETGPVARQYRTLEASFPGQSPLITSVTRDGAQQLVQVWSDRNPGDFYVFNPAARTAEHVIGLRKRGLAGSLAATQPISFKARDGLAVHGFLTRPGRGEAKHAPMVVLPHGGPFGIYDTWQFDREVQMLADAGYAVLRVNFRGSGNHGRAFQQAGARQWGAAMQDDVTDATRWAIAQGHADASRICIAGASYGGYAALVGVAREPSLYRCAIGYVGVYDLPMLVADARREGRSLGNWSMDWVGGDDAALRASSPNRMADRIKVPVFLAAGGEDEIAPIEHSRRMERALREAGVPVETMYEATEGHGFFREENRKAYAEKVLAFLGRHIGPGAATQPAAAP